MEKAQDRRDRLRGRDQRLRERPDLGSASKLRLAVLGSAAGGGFPQWNSAADACRRARAGEPAALPRTQTSVAVSGDGQSWVILNASPDLPAQIRAAPFLAPTEAPRSSPIAAVALTGAEVDVIAGLLSLREGHPFTIYATPAVLAVLDANPIFDVLARSRVNRLGLAAGERADLPGGLALELFPVPGKAPLYSPGGSAEGMATAAEISDGRRRTIFAPSFARLTGELAARLATADVVLFDASFWSEDEIVALTGKKASDMGHLPLSGPGGSLAALAPLPARKILIHMNHSNPVLVSGSSERAEVERAGFEVAWDGMEIAL